MIFLLQILFFRVPNGPRVWRTHRIGWPTWQTDTRVLTTFATLQGKKNILVNTYRGQNSIHWQKRVPFQSVGTSSFVTSAPHLWEVEITTLQYKQTIATVTIQQYFKNLQHCHPKCTVISENNIKHPYVCLWTELMWQIFIHIWICNCSADCRNAE